MFTSKKGIMNLGFEEIDGAPVEAGDEVIGGVDEAEVIEAGEGADEQAVVDAQVTEITTTIEDALGVVEGADEVIEQNETALANAEEITADVVQASQESLAQARALMGMTKKSNMSFESIAANPRTALTLSNEDWKETAKLLLEKAKEFFKGLLALMKKGYTAVMKMTAADISTLDAMVKKVKASATLEASVKDGKIFASTTTKVRAKLAGALATVGHSDLNGANFVKGLEAVISLVNDKNIVTQIPEALAKAFTSGSFGVEATTGKINLGGNFSIEKVAGNIKANFAGMDKADIANSGIMAVNFSGSKVKILNHKVESNAFAAKEAFVNSITVAGVTKENLLAVLNALRAPLTKNKEFFDAGDAAITKVETAFDAYIKSDKGGEKSGQEKLALKVATRISRGVVYDSILNKISTDRAILSVVSMIANGKADAEPAAE